ncbi:hypothetical protein BKA66DRAFT_79973 [Pyrenochaeta sp. MPI-SDFR-AT-0127]|nr:hypothetical protein BKA66DRAFT_79973 [Pyrenochaeta sp. MPI-SDFR-AT-0127]
MSLTVSRQSFEVTLWTFCGLSTIFLASRFAVRIWKKGRLRKSDYFLIIGLPSLFAGAALLQTTLDVLYAHWPASVWVHSPPVQQDGIIAAPRLTSAIELLWVAIYCVKASFFAQFKFHKPPYSYVSPSLTRYYWTAISICGLAFVFTLITPAVLCPNAAKCRYFSTHNTVALEIVLTVLDIVTDLLVLLIPIWLIRMANFTLTRAAINASFKSLSIFTVGIAAARLVFQYRADHNHINYLILTFWLSIEAAVAVIMASISSYRVVVLDYLTDYKARQDLNPTHRTCGQILRTWKVSCQNVVAKITAPLSRARLESPSELSLQ